MLEWKIMKRLILSLVFVLAISISLFASIYPVDETIGLVDEGPALLLEALKQEYSSAWLETYVSPSFRLAFDPLYSEALTVILPLSNPVTATDGNEVKVRDLEDNAIYSFFLDDEGMIETFVQQ